MTHRVAVIASASGNGKTTLARELARRLGVEAIELDALVHGPNWTETPDAELRERLAPMLARDTWVCDGTYRNKLGDLVLDAADTVIWLDLPIVVWLPRLIRRTAHRIRYRETLWNGNRETLKGAIGSRDALIPYALAHARSASPHVAPGTRTMARGAASIDPRGRLSTCLATQRLDIVIAPRSCVSEDSINQRNVMR